MRNMHKALVHAGFLVIVLIGISSCSRSKNNKQAVSPGSTGFSEEKLALLEEHLTNSGSSALLIMLDGEVIFDWGETRKKHTVHSIRKALLNSIFGQAVGRGQIDTSMTLGDLMINDIYPGLTSMELDARISDLLKSRSGVYHPAAGVSKGMLAGKPEREEFAPGEHFYYNNWDFNALGAILEKATGRSLYELYEEDIAKPLGMKDYKGKYCSIDGESQGAQIPETDGFYQYEYSKSDIPAYHFRMSARDLALYGQLYLDRGTWNGKQIIPESWIESSTRQYSVYNSQHGIGYGMLWYVQGNSFFHTGVGVHMLAIYPDCGMVLVHRVDTEKPFDFDKGNLYKMIGLIFDTL